VVVPSVGDLLGNVPAIRPTLLTEDVLWPNEVRPTPTLSFFLVSPEKKKKAD
jgi:hypothetical protein